MLFTELIQKISFQSLDLQLLAWVLGIFSLLMFLVSLIVVPLVIISLPEDYLCSEPGPEDYKNRLGYWFWILFPLKNVLGMLCLILGFIMLITPGQGLLTILIGLMLINFPGKRSLIRRLLARPALLKSINWIRKLAQRAPVRKPSESNRNQEFA